MPPMSDEIDTRTRRAGGAPVSTLDLVVRPGHHLLGKYRVERVIGRGGMGVVIAVRHMELGELFAIKLLTPTAGSLNAPVRFLREAQAAARLRSDHAVRVFDVGRFDDGTPYLVMEYLEGENLAEVLARRRRLPLAEVVSLVLAACDALAEAHALGIVHRDLKLSNLFLSERRDGRPHLKVIDFGISKLSGEADQLTAPDAIVGSPACMSPEQCNNAQLVDGRSDIWALGVVLYQLLTGDTPFHGSHPMDMLWSLLRDEPTPPSRLCPELPPAVDEVVARCLRKLPEERYSDIAALVTAVRALAPAAGAPASSFTRAAPRVYISCRGDDSEGLRVATALLGALAAAGLCGFLPAHSAAAPGAWIRDASVALSGCDAFVVLLSPLSAVSEVVAGELDMAQTLAARGAGRPCVLPVRVRLPENMQADHPLHERLQDLEHATWNDESGAAELVEWVIARIARAPACSVTLAVPAVAARGMDPAAPAHPPRATPPVPAALELPGGPVARRSPFYVVRPLVDDACLREVLRPGALIRIKGPRQMGKSSLMMGIAEHAARSGAGTVTVNLQMADAAMLADQNRLLRWLCALVTRRLKLPVARIDEHWDDVFGAKDNCTAYFEDHLLTGGPLVVALDNVDRLFEAPATAEDILALLRAWHEMGKVASPWNALRLALSYSTEIYLPLHTNHSPFNVGLPVVVGEWDGEIAHDLARRHGLTWGRGEVDQLMAVIGGHPHLVRIALYHVARGMTLEAVLATAGTDEGLFADHLRHLLWQVQSRADLREATSRVMEASEPVRLDTELAFKLVSLGLASMAGNGVRPARALYRTYFQNNLTAA